MGEAQQVTLFFESSFDDSLSFRDRCKKFVKNLLNPGEHQIKEGEDLKDQQQANEVKQVGRDVSFSVSCRIS